MMVSDKNPPLIRLFLRNFWHQRPGHTPHATLMDSRGIYCAACGSIAPGGA